MSLQTELQLRHLPEILPDDTPWPIRRAEIQKILEREIYGAIPPAPECVHAQILEEKAAYAGKAVRQQIALTWDTPKGPFTFPFYLVVPKSEQPVPAVVHISFSPLPDNDSSPMEELIDHGFAIAGFFYRDVANDTDDGFTSGLGPLYITAPRQPEDPGTISLWAFAASRVLDYLLTRPEICHEKIAVAGHSRLGKAALWAGACDTRFYAVYSNNSGCSGAAITRGKVGENVQVISTNFPYWFCPNYQQYKGREDAMPFDQHFLLALVAPRLLYVASAEEDTWADPASEFLSAVEAGRVYTLLGVQPLVCEDRLPVPPDSYPDGRIGYHIRRGTHFLSRYDWDHFLNFLIRHNQ